MKPKLIITFYILLICQTFIEKGGLIRDIKRRTLTIIFRRLRRSGETFGRILEKIDEGPSRFPSISKRSNFQANGETNY